MLLKLFHLYKDAFRTIIIDLMFAEMNRKTDNVSITTHCTNNGTNLLKENR
jgi:hypothetical protein